MGVCKTYYVFAKGEEWCCNFFLEYKDMDSEMIHG